MHTIFKQQPTEKNGLLRWFSSMGGSFLTGTFLLLFSSVGLAAPPVPLPPHPPGLGHPPLPPGPPLPHQVLPLPPGPPGVIHHPPGLPPHPGWVWMPGYHRGNRWVPGNWSKPKRHRPRYDHDRGPRYYRDRDPRYYHDRGPRYDREPGPHPPHGRVR